MHKIDTANAVASMPTPSTPGTPGYFSHGDPTTGTPYTTLSSDWANAVQMEIANVITGAGIALDKTSQNQLYLAINDLISGSVVTSNALTWMTTIWPDSGTANAMAVTLSPAPANLAALIGVPFMVSKAAPNTGALTISVNGLAATDLVYCDDTPFASGQWTGGDGGIVVYNGVSFICMNLPSRALLATTAFVIGTKGGSTTLTYPGASAAAGTIGSSGWREDASGKITNWVCIQLADTTNTTWTFPKPFVTGVLTFRYFNVSAAAGQTGNADIGITNLQSTNGTTTATFSSHNTGTPGLLVAYLIEAEGY